MIVKGVRAARAGRRYVFARWDGGMLGGREARPGIGGFVGATHVLVGFLFLAGVISGRWPRPDIAFQLIRYETICDATAENNVRANSP